MRPTVPMAAGLLALAGLKVYLLRPGGPLSRWGTTGEEARETLPGDELVPVATSRTTRAVSVAAPPEGVWPWLVQLGQGRGGLYSYDALENLLGLDIHSADRVVPELQDLAVGDEVRLVPPGTEPDLTFRVTRLEPPHVLVLGPRGSRDEAFAQGLPFPVWAFVVRPGERPGTSRLLTRFTLQAPPRVLSALAYRWALAPVHFVMERRMLLGIRERAERAGSLSGRPGTRPA